MIKEKTFLSVRELAPDDTLTPGTIVRPLKIRNILHNDNIPERASQKEPYICETNRQKIFAFYKTYFNILAEFWENGKFSDEKQV